MLVFSSKLYRKGIYSVNSHYIYFAWIFLSCQLSAVSPINSCMIKCNPILSPIISSLYYSIQPSLDLPMHEYIPNMETHSKLNGFSSDYVRIHAWEEHPIFGFIYKNHCFCACFQVLILTKRMLINLITIWICNSIDCFGKKNEENALV